MTHFVLENAYINSGAKLKIVEPLIQTQKQAEQRAMAEFLEQSYATNTCTFETYITSLNINDIVAIEGKRWKVIAFITRSTDTAVLATVTAERYEKIKG